MALEWLKGILGTAYTEEIDKKVSEEIDGGFVPRTEHEAATAAKTSLEARLKTADETISGFKSMDVDGIKAEAEKYRIAAEQAEKSAGEKIASMQFDVALDGAIRNSQGRNSTAVKALLDLDALRGSKNQSDDIKAAIEAIKTSDGYLFEPAKATVPPPYAAGTGTGALSAPGDTYRTEMAAAMFGDDRKE